MDVAGIEAGVDFVEVINQAIDSCDVLLAVIGREWVTCSDGLKRRIDNPNDFIRLELEMALKRNVPIIPVLVEGAQIPSITELPNDLKALVYHQSFELRDNFWESDIRRLIDQLGCVNLEISQPPHIPVASKGWITHAIIICTAIVIVIIASLDLLLPSSSTQQHSEIPSTQDFSTLESVATLQLPKPSNQEEQTVTLLSGNPFFSVSEENITQWNPNINRIENSFKITDYLTASIRLSDGRLALGTRDGAIAIWNPKTNKTEFTLPGHSGAVTALAVMADGLLVSGGWDKAVKIWNIETAKLHITLEGHINQIRALAVFADNRVVSASMDGAIKLWNLEKLDNVKVRTFNDNNKPVNALAILIDARLAAGTEDGVIKVWNLTTGKAETQLAGHHDWINALVALPDGRLASGSDDANVIVWNLGKREPDVILKGHLTKVTSLVLYSNEHIASASVDGVIKLWDISSLH